MRAQSRIGLNLQTLTISVLTLIPLAMLGQPTNAQEIRAAYRQQGFKVDLSDFNFTVSKELSDRAAAFIPKSPPNMQAPISFLDNADLLTPVGAHEAIVVWKQEALAYPSGFHNYSYLFEPGTEKDVWPAQRGLMEDTNRLIASTAAAIASGPFGFSLHAEHGINMLLPHLAGLKHFEDIFAGGAVLALHDEEPDVAWTNLLAATRVVTGWQIEPTEVSQTVRFNCLETAYDVTWQALQCTNWTDAQLGRLQREWESLDVFKPLPDTVAFMGASYVAEVQQQDDLSSIEAERTLLAFYHDREVEMRRAVQSPSWAQMKTLPEMENVFFFLPAATNLPRNVAMRLDTRRMTLGMSSGGVSLPARAAEAETRRRVLVTAIALERFHLRHGAYPRNLGELVPDWIGVPLVDFMNGEPLHYEVVAGGQFLLYSVGLNGVDNGGKMEAISHDDPIALRSHHDPDIVWPLPASATLTASHEAEEKKRADDLQAMIKKREADHEAEVAAARLAARNELLNNPKYKKTTWIEEQGFNGEPKFKGQSLPEFFRNEKSTGTNQLSVDQLLTLTPVVTGNEPHIITYQVPIAYDRLTNAFGSDLSLSMDSPTDNDYLVEPEMSDCERATNGDCLLVWNPNVERLGQHAMQAVLMFQTRLDHEVEVKGPVLPFTNTNLFQFNVYSTLFNDSGANLYARLSESNATYSVEIKARSGKHIRTLTGSTTNGLILLDWKLIDDQGVKFTNNTFRSYFTVTLPSGRSQTLDQIQNKVGTRGDDE